MTDRERIATGIGYAAWGYFFLIFDFRINAVTILPDFIGYVLFFRALKKLAAERPDFPDLHPLCWILMVWNSVDWVFSWAGRSIDGRFLLLDLLVLAVSLYFAYQFLTGLAFFAERFQPEGETLDRKILRRWNVFMVLTTVGTLLLYLPETWRELPLLVLALPLLIVAILIMAGLFQLRRYVRTAPEDEAE